MSKTPALYTTGSQQLEIDALSDIQKRYIDQFTARYNEKTKKSKAWSAAYHPVHADWTCSLRYCQTLKEMKYPIVLEKSQGSRIWDIDGNEYLDMLMGYGADFLGHRPFFVMEAISRQLEKGIHIGPGQVEITGEVAQMICELTGVERVMFSNSGTEAVMGAMRIARAYTKRNKIVMFKNSYHGHADGLMPCLDENGRIVPAVAGVPQKNVDELIYIDYGTEASLEIIRNRGNEIAGVIVEPIPLRNIDWLSRDFLERLREITAENGSVLIFDEIITGFRIHPGGAQKYFNIKADLVTYGKAASGGMPIGIIAGRAPLMDMVDGGVWNFGDNSAPPSSMTFVAGTFCKHPLTMAAMKASLMYFKEHGTQAIAQANRLTSELTERMNAYFKKNNICFATRHFSSLLQFTPTVDLSPADLRMLLLYIVTLEKGIFSWTGINFCLSTAHESKDIDFFFNAYQESIEELQQNGFSFAA